MSKDPFQILADELTLIRKDMDHLQRTSLDKDEAQTLNQAVMKAAASMVQTIKAAPGEIQKNLEFDRDQMAHSATQAATRAAESAIAGIRHDLDNERAKLSRAAGEARREAWRYFGGFWVWLTSMLATGLALGLLLAYGTETAKSALSVDDLVRYSCGRSWFGGQVVQQDNGSSYCAFWINRPDQ